VPDSYFFWLNQLLISIRSRVLGWKEEKMNTVKTIAKASDRFSSAKGKGGRHRLNSVAMLAVLAMLSLVVAFAAFLGYGGYIQPGVQSGIAPSNVVALAPSSQTQLNPYSVSDESALVAPSIQPQLQLALAPYHNTGFGGYGGYIAPSGKPQIAPSIQPQLNPYYLATLGYGGYIQPQLSPYFVAPSIQPQLSPYLAPSSYGGYIQPQLSPYLVAPSIQPQLNPYIAPSGMAIAPSIAPYTGVGGNDGTNVNWCS
jgi:hypothetical protein